MPRALVVDDKKDVLEYVGEILEHSLQHKFEVAGNNEDARKLLATKDFDYVLLDLRIPASSRGGDPRIQNGVSLFQQILKIKGVGKVAIIIMTSHTVEAWNFAGDFQNDGLTFFLAKDLWDQTRTVEVAVTEAMNALEARRQSTGSSERPKQPGRGSVGCRMADDAPIDRPGSPAASPQAAQWPDVPNEPITVDAFMARFCEAKKKDYRMYRKRALLAAARHKTVTMPPLASPRKHGQPNTYWTHDLLRAWQGYRDEDVELPALRS
ncbi:MAG: hypothetical protein BIFFINMI_00589 [Phycisphaerae bacterium]|nr:hypothetical protein [Phycisphaerae bacterium]